MHLLAFALNTAGDDIAACLSQLSLPRQESSSVLPHRPVEISDPSTVTAQKRACEKALVARVPRARPGSSHSAPPSSAAVASKSYGQVSCCRFAHRKTGGCKWWCLHSMPRIRSRFAEPTSTCGDEPAISGVWICLARRPTGNGSSRG